MKSFLVILSCLLVSVSFGQNRTKSGLSKGELLIGEQSELIYEFEFESSDEALSFIPLIGKIPCMKRNENSSLKLGLGTLGALPVGLLVLSIGLSLGGTTGYAINPARDLGPRIVHFFLPIPGKRDSDWNYAWVPVLGPIVGALAAVLAFAVLKIFAAARAVSRPGVPDARVSGARRAARRGPAGPPAPVA